jgi:hypothetical protein
MMISRPLLNNVKNLKKRDVSMDQKVSHQHKASLGGNTKLPVINVHQKCLKKEGGSRPQSKTRAHSRIASFDQRKMSLILQQNNDPKEVCKQNLKKDYGQGIDAYLKNLELNSACSSEQLLSGHEITGVYRAKMVDWMVEVMTAFKCADQTFFLAISIMDRYFAKLSQQGEQIKLQDLHTIGITCMFMASKYEDIYPLLLRTVYQKIGHKKIASSDIRDRELMILRALGFQLGAPTSYEFLERYIEDVLGKHEEKDFINLMSVYLGKMALHHEGICSKKSSLIGSATIYVALKICEQMRQKPILTPEIQSKLVLVSGLKERELIDCSKKLLYLAQNFEKELPGLKNLKGCYIPQLNKFVQ